MFIGDDVVPRFTGLFSAFVDGRCFSGDTLSDFVIPATAIDITDLFVPPFHLE
jgi:hypothetical protein